MLKIYNTLSRKKEEFRPRVGKKAKLFVCGPTVYDLPHIGHARTYVVFDMIAKYLKENGYKVSYLQNITDIDDKIINRARENKILPEKLARDFERAYLDDMTELGIKNVKYARATDHIKEIVSQVKRLFRKKYAYLIEDGAYYDISRFKEYGKLSGRTALQAEDAVSRVDESKEKRNKGDFCLWKYSKEGEPSWPFDSQNSFRVKPGRPGWHIEDTAIAEKYFGPQYDIHGGGIDLLFPHHEAEIAQMEAISGKRPYVKYWLHTGFLTINGQKMSKSLGNFITIRDFLKGNSARALRLLVLKNHYRSPIDYSEKEINLVENQLKRIDEFISKLQSPINPNKNPRIFANQIRIYPRAFEKAMQDDFNTPKAIAAIFGLIGKGNSLLARNKLSSSAAKNILNFLKGIDKFFNFIFWQKSKEKITQEVWRLVREREKLRKKNLWQKADEMREKIKKAGYEIKDTQNGPKIKKI